MDSGKKRKEPAINAPKKAKLAFDFFVIAKRSEAEAKIGDANKAKELNYLLKSMWNDLGSKARIKYEKMEQEDKQRYDREIAADKANQHRSKSSSSSSSSSQSQSRLQSNSNGQQR